MKKLFLWVFVLMLMFTFVGCREEAPPQPPNNAKEEMENGENKGEVPTLPSYTVDEKLKPTVQVVEEEKVLEEAREWFEQFHKEKGAYVYQHPEATYVQINIGEKPTGGYGIHVTDYLEEEYPRVIKIQIQGPGQDTVVTQALTYPSMILQIQSHSASQYQVKTEKGEVLEGEEKLVFGALTLPKENEKIENPVRLQGKIIAFEGAFVVRILDHKENVIHEAHLQGDAGGPSWGNFDELVTYPQPPGEKGSIELGEYSAKDGEYIMRAKVGVQFK